MQPQQNNQGQNPYQSLIEQFMQKQQGMMGQGMGQGMEQEQPTQPVPQTNGKTPPDTDMTHVGVGSQAQSSLISAINSLNKFITVAQDKDDVQVSQTILSLLADLLQRNKTKDIELNNSGQSAGDQAKQMMQGAPQMGA